ncbi:uncharacterized protein Z520_00957 [Fonsecaea multimorphosa CBS 102226]|uniref:Uncharacterized protein n=1 Tax=Fonsecaea multimorphosa CBS 102226 TaxID=1442371 RepID=A0A0D2IZK5_9EURO|nr:uncharacterized protein Z520_00957 [Fonsecaea multimorphosa CBS 102226]KIY02492.1 hypothetical protein Z520_00957 [Fonsecaea multimorphosa CBS 102226]OAL31360.1 hypothetical protein AYO22_00952 [Fonsecaea multimorphosa]
MSTHKASAVTIDEFSLPRGRNATGALLAATLMILSARRRFIEPGSLLHDQVIARSGARVAKYSRPVQDAIFYTLYGLHGVGTVYFALTKLKKHNVKILSPVWFQWILAAFFGGSFATKHFDEEVEKKELKTIKEI